MWRVKNELFGVTQDGLEAAMDRKTLTSRFCAWKSACCRVMVGIFGLLLRLELNGQKEKCKNIQQAGFPDGHPL